MSAFLPVLRSLQVRLCSYGLALALCSLPKGWAEENEDSEPSTRFDMGWEVGTPAGGNWLPDVASNRSGTFLRKWNRIFLLESMSEDSWNSLRNSFHYGGLLPATSLATVYMTLFGANALGLMASNNFLARWLSYAGYGIGTAGMVYTWGWQLKNAYYNGWSSGYWYLGTHFLGGLESHQQGIQSYQRARRQSRTSVPVRPFNVESALVPPTLLAAWFVDKSRRLFSGQIVSAVDIRPPACLADQVFMDIMENDSAMGGTTLRMHRIPRALRDEKRDHISAGCKPWRDLLKTMDRDRIDRLTIKPRTKVSGTYLYVGFLDHRSTLSGLLKIKIGPPTDQQPWVEQLLTDGFSRREADNFRSTLHPAYMGVIQQVLDCYKSLPDGESIATCEHGTLHNTSTKERIFSWEAKHEPEATSWIYEVPGKTIFYYGYPHHHAPYITWSDSYSGPYLELQDGTPSEEPKISQYRFSERVSYALTGELDYLARHLPHMILGRAAIPGMKALFESAGSTSNNVPSMNSIEDMSVRYAPGWLTNIYSVFQPVSSYLSRHSAASVCSSCRNSLQ